MALNLVMLGPPGAGKGTQAERFAREHGIPKVSTGDILREAVHSGSELGSAVKVVMERGELVGDDLIIGIVRERLSRPDAVAGFVLDGFPRTAAQANALDEITAARGPVIFASSILTFPTTFRGMATPGGWADTALRQIDYGMPLYNLTYVLGIIFFAYFYTAIIFNPDDVSENMRKYGGFIPGIRPGKRTAEYIDTILAGKPFRLRALARPRRAEHHEVQGHASRAVPGFASSS